MMNIWIFFLKQIAWPPPGPFSIRRETPNLRTDLVFSLLMERGTKESQFVSESINHENELKSVKKELLPILFDEQITLNFFHFNTCS